MSKRVTTQSLMTNKDILAQAVEACGAASRTYSNTSVEIRIGRSVGTLDLKSGKIEGDDMSFNESDFDALKQSYAERAYNFELLNRGGTVHDRTVLQNGDIVFLCQIS